MSRSIGIVLLALLSAGCAAPDGTLRLTWSAAPDPPRSNLTQWNWNRQIAVDDAGAVQVVWAQLATTSVDQPADRADPVDASTLPAGQIFYLRSNDGGDTWESEVALTLREVGIDSGCVASSGASVYVLYRALEDGRLRVFARSSFDRGLSWGLPVAVSDNPVGISVSPPAFAADGASIDAVWADARSGGVKEVHLASSADGGLSWSPAQPVSVPDGFSSWTPSIAASAGAIHVAWTDERDDVGECTRDGNPCREEEYYRRSLDGGASWDPEVRLTNDPAESWAPSIAVAQSSVHVAYLDRRSGAFQNYYRRSLDGGASFEPELQLPSDPAFTNAARPTIAARDSDVHLAWFGFTDFEADVYYARSRDAGETWAPYANLTAGANGAARIPHVAAGANGTPHLVWYDTRASDVGGPRIELAYRRIDPDLRR